MSYNVLDRILTQKDYTFIEKNLRYKFFKINYFTKNYTVRGLGFLVNTDKCLKFFCIEKPTYQAHNTRYFKKDSLNNRVIYLNKKNKFTLFPMTLIYNYESDNNFNKLNYIK